MLTRRRFRPLIPLIGLLSLGLDSLLAYDFNLLLRNGRVVDGTGTPWYVADVAVSRERIAAIGRLDPERAERVIDISGLVIAPGFVDMMGQTAAPLLKDPSAAMNLLTQGITTINAGEGYSDAPAAESSAQSRGWTTMAEYFQLLDLRGMPVNVVQTVGHTTVRDLVLGDIDRRPSDEELDRMKAYVREGMEAGAIGVSTALIYPPAVFAQTKEIAALAGVAGEYGGRYYSHIRNEGDRLLEAIDEAIEIGREANTPVHVFHLKAAGQRNWGKMEQAIARIKSARAQGQQVTADVYPYINNGLDLSAFIHPRNFSQGSAVLLQRLADNELRATIRREMEEEEGWENWYRHTGNDWNKVIVGAVRDDQLARFAGQSIGQIAAERGEDPWETFFTFVRAGSFALPETMSEANKIRAMREEFVSFCTDVGPAAGSSIAGHPRAFGSFPRLLSRYVRDLGAISLEAAVSKAAASAANNVMAYDRGRIAIGQAADIIVFDAATVADRATFAEPHKPSVGVKHVLVNGELVLEDGQFTGKRPGRVLRGPGYCANRAPRNVATGEADPRLDSFDKLMRGFMEQNRIPGAAIAVTDHGRLVYARGYGYADLANRDAARPTSLFRIASISKPITAVAILQLVEQGKIRLDDKIFAVLKPREPDPNQAGTPEVRLKEITIRHLLEHRGGWDRDQSFDAMFQSVRFARQLGLPPPADQECVIRCMLTQPLDFTPGERYAYANFGYCLLGRLIEEQTGQSYEEYVRGRVLEPLGIHGMRLGRTRLDGRIVPDEVRYYDANPETSVFAKDVDQPVASPYGAWNLEAMDAHGGWIASAIDLARFAVAFDDPENCPVLQAETVRRMFERPPGLAGYDENGVPKETYYSLGWMNRPVGDQGVNSWHTGSLPGTATILVRRHDGKNWVVLFNARENHRSNHFTRELDPLLHEAADTVKEWPAHDLFPK